MCWRIAHQCLIQKAMVVSDVVLRDRKEISAFQGGNRPRPEIGRFSGGSRLIADCDARVVRHRVRGDR